MKNHIRNRKRLNVRHEPQVLVQVTLTNQCFALVFFVFPLTKDAIIRLTIYTEKNRINVPIKRKPVS